MVRHYIMSGVPYSSVPILTATPGIVKESQAVVVDENKDITGFKDITATGDITGANITTILTNIGDRAQELIDAGLDAVFPFTASSPCDTVWATLLFTWQRLIQLNVSLDAIDSTYSDGNNSNIGIGVQNDNATEKLHVVGNIQADGGNIQANNIKSFYQTVNSLKSNVADNNNTTTQVTNSGCPSNASDWTRYTGWITTGVDTTNTDSAIFEPKDYGFQAKVAGTYKVNVHMAFQTFSFHQNVAIRLAKNNLVNDVDDSDNENPGPISSTGYIPGNGSFPGRVHCMASSQITHIMTLAVNDEVSLYTVNIGNNLDSAGNNVHTRRGYSQFLVEYLG